MAAHRADARSCPVRLISPSTSGAHKPPSHRTSVLVRCVSDRLLTKDIWIGEVSSIPRGLRRRVGSAGAAEGGRGYRFSFSYSVTDIEVLADPDRLAIAADANKRVPGCGRNKQNQRTSIKSIVAGFGGLCVVTAKHLVPRSAERVSAAPPSRGDPRP